MRISLMQGALCGFPAEDRGRRVPDDGGHHPGPARGQIPGPTGQDRDHLVYDPEYLGIVRIDGVVVIQVTLNKGLTTDMKKLLCRALAEGLHRDLGVRMEDVSISLVEVKKENWSFGNGVPQYAV